MVYFVLALNLVKRFFLSVGSKSNISGNSPWKSKAMIPVHKCGILNLCNNWWDFIMLMTMIIGTKKVALNWVFMSISEFLIKKFEVVSYFWSSLFKSSQCCSTFAACFFGTIDSAHFSWMKLDVGLYAWSAICLLIF